MYIYIYLYIIYIYVYVGTYIMLLGFSEMYYRMFLRLKSI